MLLFIAVWLPWFGLSNGGYSYRLGGINAHAYLAFVVLTTVLLMTYLGARAGWDRLPVRLPFAHAPALLVVGVVQVVIVLIAFLIVPRNLGHEFGSWLALIAALAAVLPVAIPAIQAAQRH